METNEYPTLQGKRVLVVDDNITNLMVAKRSLKRLGIKATVADSGTEAIDILKDETFDCILLDIQMPILDGFQTARQLREDGLDIPIIAYTAHALGSDVQKCLDAGMNEHLAKPVLLDKLAEKLLSVLS